MQDIVTRRTTWLGLVSWLGPFVVSFLFVDQTGQFIIPQPLFKSLMVVFFGGVGAALLVIAFRRVVPSLRNGLLLGLYWFAINIVLDLLILVPLIGMPVVTYIYDIGLRYLLIPIMSIAMGAVSTTAGRQPG